MCGTGQFSLVHATQKHHRLQGSAVAVSNRADTSLTAVAFQAYLL